MKAMQPSQQNPGCLALLMNRLGLKMGHPRPAEDSGEDLPAEADALLYRRRDDFLSPAEQSFYQVIQGMLGSSLTICPKVSLADIFFVVRPNENRSAFNRINRKHVDFLVCHSQTMAPLFAIELDDSSHHRADRMERDALVDRVFEAAELPLLHIPVRPSYNTSELRVLFKQVLEKDSLPVNDAHPKGSPGQPVQASQSELLKVQEAESSSRPPVPNCPKCGTPMVLRTAKNGDQPGKRFYGCANYPRCRVILPFEERNQNPNVA